MEDATEEMMEGAESTGEGDAGAVNGPGPIRNMAVLDLTGMQSPDDLSRITRIENVALILVPESLAGRLLSLPMKNVALTIPIPEGDGVRVMTGQIQLSGEALANPHGGGEDQTLVLTGQIFITSPVESVAYRRIIIAGQVFVPKGSEGTFGSAVTRLTGQTIYYTGKPRFYNGENRFAKGFFDFLDEPVSLLINGKGIVEPDVTVEVLKQKVTGIVLNGNLVAPRALIPALMALTTEQNGEIMALEDEKEVPEGDG